MQKRAVISLHKVVSAMLVVEDGGREVEPRLKKPVFRCHGNFFGPIGFPWQPNA
jgi:hypothetical protein